MFYVYKTQYSQLIRRKPLKKTNLGPSSDPDTKGFFIHPGAVVDATTKDVLGVSSVIAWSRSDKPSAQENKRRSMNQKNLFVG